MFASDAWTDDQSSKHEAWRDSYGVETCTNVIKHDWIMLLWPEKPTRTHTNWGTNVITVVCQILWHNLCWARFFHTMNRQKNWRCVLSHSKARCSDMGSLWACPVSGDIGRSCCFGPLVLWFQRVPYVPCCRCVSTFPRAVGWTPSGAAEPARERTHQRRGWRVGRVTRWVTSWVTRCDEMWPVTTGTAVASCSFPSVPQHLCTGEEKDLHFCMQ